MSSIPLDMDKFVASAMAEYMGDKESKPEPDTPAPAPAPTVAKKVVLKEGESMFSDVFGNVPKNIPDFAVAKFMDVPAELSAFIPKVDTDYVVQVEEAAAITSAIVDGDKVLISGPTGSGKSSLVKYVCAKLGAPFIRINMSADAESSTLFGQLVARDGSTVWEDGPITEAVRHGGVVLIDEWELMPPEISMGLQNLLEDDGYLYLKERPGSSEDKTIMPHKNFRIICAGNTVGQGDDSGAFSGTSVQNSATLDRFTTTVHLGYLDTKHEINVIRNRSKVSRDVANNMVKFAHLVRNAYNNGAINLTMSPRTLINWAQKIDKHGDVKAAFNLAFMAKLRESDKKVVSDVYTKVFG